MFFISAIYEEFVLKTILTHKLPLMKYTRIYITEHREESFLMGNQKILFTKRIKRFIIDSERLFLLKL